MMGAARCRPAFGGVGQGGREAMLASIAASLDKLVDQQPGFGPCHARVMQQFAACCRQDMVGNTPLLHFRRL
jgi:hypothetical protein